jgi:hypothetical protein
VQGMLRARGLLARGGASARREVMRHTCDINLATGCVRALPFLLPSCGRKGGKRARGLLLAGGRALQRMRRRGKGGRGGEGKAYLSK